MAHNQTTKKQSPPKKKCGDCVTVIVSASVGDACGNDESLNQSPTSQHQKKQVEHRLPVPEHSTQNPHASNQTAHLLPIEEAPNPQNYVEHLPQNQIIVQNPGVAQYAQSNNKPVPLNNIFDDQSSKIQSEQGYFRNDAGGSETANHPRKVSHPRIRAPTLPMDNQQRYLQKEFDRIQDSTNAFENKITDMEERLYHIKRDLAEANLEILSKQREVDRLRTENSYLRYTNMRQAMEIESLKRSLHVEEISLIRKNIPTLSQLEKTDKPPWKPY